MNDEKRRIMRGTWGFGADLRRRLQADANRRGFGLEAAGGSAVRDAVCMPLRPPPSMTPGEAMIFDLVRIARKASIGLDGPGRPIPRSWRTARPSMFWPAVCG